MIALQCIILTQNVREKVANFLKNVATDRENYATIEIRCAIK